MIVDHHKMFTLSLNHSCPGFDCYNAMWHCSNNYHHHNDDRHICCYNMIFLLIFSQGLPRRRLLLPLQCGKCCKWKRSVWVQPHICRHPLPYMVTFTPLIYLSSLLKMHLFVVTFLHPKRRNCDNAELAKEQHQLIMFSLNLNSLHT